VAPSPQDLAEIVKDLVYRPMIVPSVAGTTAG
jgi:hypothetical protein